MSDPASTQEESYSYLLFVLILSGLSLAALAARTLLPLTPGSEVVLRYADNVVCGLFLVDFAICLRRSDRKARYLLTWGWLDLISSAPMLEPLRLGRIARMIRIVRVLRTMRASRALTDRVLQRRAQGAFLASCLITGILLLFGSVAVLQFETAPGANLKTAPDALWWAIVTLTSVGYGDYYPITLEGRLIASLLMVSGLSLFGAISGFVASWFLGVDEKAQEDELRQIHEELSALRKALEERGAT